MWRAVSGVVAGQHHHLQPQRLHLPDGFGRIGLERVGDRHQPDELALRPDHDHRLAGRLQAVDLGLRRLRDGDPAAVPPSRVCPRPAGRPSTRPWTPWPPAAWKSANGSSATPSAAPVARPPVPAGARSPVRARRPAAAGPATADAARRERHEVGHLGLAAGEGAGLVQHDRGQPARGLQRLAALEQDAVLGALAGAHHDRRRAWPARARTGRR